ncbi:MULTISPECIES: hypothetical protein [unclassified Modestobacter]|uniref:hypothetical protein n=1 Tax=unclassified Modestobacter TaxID=2643866 RepID=UPI0022AB3A2C|nr:MULTISPECIES: hypothetical protein [unclassified Modestobacter]MCZ2814230.1 hypothetical protein [Modestobacter sp. VKM Ac-2979]MCZ2844078.1 hypothetical protein [Modestobacter sp. VKM Ac-2980]MCZ2849245.1 hypothetical protein [Modestobacter sp. VKM Ac-2978]
MTTLLVDVANTVGARPDGWWRDRAGATARLLERLAALPGRELTGPDGEPVPVTALVAVVEGQARDVSAPAGLRVVRAPGSGDDALAETAADLADGDDDLLVVTADRGLRDRLPAVARIAGPGWLLAAADRAADPAEG